MSKKSEKESVKQKENNPELTNKKEVNGENSEKKEPQEPLLIEDDKEIELKKLKEEITKLKNDKLLLLAELENKRKDFQQQMEYVYKYSNKILISQVLDFLVDLEERALKAMRSDLEDNPESKLQNQELINKFKDHLVGVEIIKNNLRKRLEDEGVKEIAIKVGEDKGNSRLHELVEEVENDNLPERTIVEVVEKGYFFHEQVLRPAKVKITKKTKTN
jgi:molecular chaperone GrpE